MRLDLLAQLLAPPRITLEAVADGLRKVTLDPTEAERKVGVLYGQTFKKREEHYDRLGGKGKMPWRRGRYGWVEGWPT